MHKLYQCDRHLAALLMLSFFLPPRVQVFVLLPLCLFFVVRDLVAKEQVKAAFLYALLLGSLYLLYVAYLPFTPKLYQPDLLFHLESKASLLALPLMMACLGKDTINTIVGQLHWFVIGCFVSCTAGNVIYVWQSYPFSGTQFLNHVTYRLAFENITRVHPTYMGMYLCLAIAILLFHSERLRLKPWQLGVLLFAAFSFLFTLFPKTPLIALLFILGYYCIHHLREKAKWRIPLISFGIALVTAFAIPFSSQRAAEMKGFFKEATPQSPIENSINMRQIIWHMDTRLLEQHWLTGLGPGRMRTELEHMYLALSVMSGLPMEYYDTHNEYFNIWISFGLIGIALFLLILLVQFILAIRQRAHLYVCLLTTLCICFLTENVLANQRGVVFYAFFTALFFFAHVRRVNTSNAL